MRGLLSQVRRLRRTNGRRAFQKWLWVIVAIAGVSLVGIVIVVVTKPWVERSNSDAVVTVTQCVTSGRFWHVDVSYRSRKNVAVAAFQITVTGVDLLFRNGPLENLVPDGESWTRRGEIRATIRLEPNEIVEPTVSAGERYLLSRGEEVVLGTICGGEQRKQVLLVVDWPDQIRLP